MAARTVAAPSTLNRPAPEPPASQHPAPEHPTPEHPTPEHPTSEHPAPEPASQARTMPAGDGSALEELIRQAITPLLREWIDRHLPELVEDIAAREVRKLLDERDRN